MTHNNLTEKEFLQQYDLKKYPVTATTVDLAIFTIRNSKLSLLLIERGQHPYKGRWALPGGFIDPTETLDEAAMRELKEETNLVIEKGYLEQLKTYGNPHRDPRGYITSVAYVALAPHIPNPTAGDDANKARFYPVEDILSGNFPLAFDHKQIIQDGLQRVRAKIEYAPVAHHFLEDETFTLSELRKVYEIVWGVELLPSNFRRKLQSVPNLLESIDGTKISNIEGGRTAELYKSGTAKEIYPPFRQPESS